MVRFVFWSFTRDYGPTHLRREVARGTQAETLPTTQRDSRAACCTFRFNDSGSTLGARSTTVIHVVTARRYRNVGIPQHDAKLRVVCAALGKILCPVFDDEH